MRGCEKKSDRAYKTVSSVADRRIYSSLSLRERGTASAVERVAKVGQKESIGEMAKECRNSQLPSTLPSRVLSHPTSDTLSDPCGATFPEGEGTWKSNGRSRTSDCFMRKGCGTIFDVRRFSTHDGAGIRTTVFFKGCPLTCAWCHNPEGIHMQRRPLFFPKKCIGCHLCEQTAEAAGEQVGATNVVAEAAVGVQTGGGQAGATSLRVRGIPYRADDAASCALWARIIADCPGDALRWDSRVVTSTALADELLRDLPFFRHGGGVTLSGGEPLLQPAFAADVLARVQAAGVHTAIETALAVPASHLQQVLPHLDHVFADCKLFDRDAHIAATGLPNDTILANLRLLLRGTRDAVQPQACASSTDDVTSATPHTFSSKEADHITRTFPTVTIRTPMIPHYTATDENVAAIARFLASENPDVPYELLNYNPLAAAKYPLVGRAYCFDENPQKFPADEMQHFAAVAREAGLRNVTIDV